MKLTLVVSPVLFVVLALLAVGSYRIRNNMDGLPNGPIGSLGNYATNALADGLWRMDQYHFSRMDDKLGWRQTVVRQATTTRPLLPELCRLSPRCRCADSIYFCIIISLLFSLCLYLFSIIVRRRDARLGCSLQGVKRIRWSTPGDERRTP